eukprot:scpid58200/ scgid33838/ Disheveled-associated activator of morphogenesis 1
MSSSQEGDSAGGAPPPAPAPPPVAPNLPGSPSIGNVQAGSAVPPGMNKLRQVTPGIKLRPLHWTRVPNQRLTESIWKAADDRINLINGQQLKQYFASTMVVKQAASTFLGSKNNDLIMDNDKARIVGIFLSSGKMAVKDIAHRLLDTDTSTRLTLDQITALQRIQPSSEERKKYEKVGSVNTDMHSVDAFMLELCKIDNLHHFLEVQQLVQEIPHHLASIPPLMDLMISACEEVFHPAFKRMLEYMLAVGNYVNSGTPRGNCYGFKISSLAQIYTMKSQVKGYTVLNYLIDTIFPHEKELERLPRIMGNARDAAGLSMRDVAMDVTKLESSLDRILSCANQIMAGKPSPAQQTFCTKILKVGQTYRVMTSKLTKKRDMMVAKLMKMAVYLGEVADDDPAELFIPIAQFLSELETATEKAAKATATRAASVKSAKATGGNGDGVASATVSQTSLPSVGPQSHAVSAIKPTRSGWMDKLGTGAGIVKIDKRWFELDDSGSIYYYKKEGGKPLGSVYLRGMSPPPALDESHTGMIVFFVEGKKWQLVSKTREEASAWLRDMLYYK